MAQAENQEHLKALPGWWPLSGWYGTLPAGPIRASANLESGEEQPEDQGHSWQWRQVLELLMEANGPQHAHRSRTDAAEERRQGQGLSRVWGMGAQGLGWLLLLRVSPLQLWEAFSRDSLSMTRGRNGSYISDKAQAATASHTQGGRGLCLSGTWGKQGQTFTVASSGTLSESHPS